MGIIAKPSGTRSASTNPSPQHSLLLYLYSSIGIKIFFRLVRNEQGREGGVCLGHKPGEGSKSKDRKRLNSSSCGVDTLGVEVRK